MENVIAELQNIRNSYDSFISNLLERCEAFSCLGDNDIEEKDRLYNELHNVIGKITQERYNREANWIRKREIVEPGFADAARCIPMFRSKVSLVCSNCGREEPDSPMPYEYCRCGKHMTGITGDPVPKTPEEDTIFGTTTLQRVFRTQDSELQKRSGETVTILHALNKNEADLEETGPMFRVKFPDGYERDVFEDELFII